MNAVNTLLKLLSLRIKVEKAYVFGSYVKGTWLKSSDIDLVIVSQDFEGMPYLKRLDLINEVQWKACIRPYVEVIALTPEEFSKKLQESAVLRDASKYWVRII
ncbi:MAG: nucleotidyltransferase domain-containing protein [Sulfolobales archaeon]|nr:nucleotidyltransferase domain-containing protein [Sulfolobales archaeon]MCX8199122.1 nucleotidyltransferase domain-containing protein [Sulfolobales archaeon]MDW8170101.1 nucleotidyltransferase domain-containing protein [Desulfurococcaceae archaeon]